MSAITGTTGQRILSDLPVGWPWLLEVANDDARSGAPGQVPTFPVVAKAEGIAHRQKVSGVWRNIGDQQTAQLVLELYASSFGYPLSLAQQVRHDAEFVVGWQRRRGGEDVLMFGEGGTDVGDAVEFRLLPMTDHEAVDLVDEYVADPHTRDQMVDLILALQSLVSRIGAELSHSGIHEIDLNPVAVNDAGDLVALDWKVFTDD